MIIMIGNVILRCRMCGSHNGYNAVKSIVTQPTFLRNISPPSSRSKNKQLCFLLVFTLVSCLAYSSTLKMEATCPSETSVDFQRTTWRYIHLSVIFYPSPSP
jgi:hypothetical protein